MNEDMLAMILTAWIETFGDEAIPTEAQITKFMDAGARQVICKTPFIIVDLVNEGYLESANSYYAGRISQKGKDFLNEYSQRH